MNYFEIIKLLYDRDRRSFQFGEIKKLAMTLSETFMEKRNFAIDVIPKHSYNIIIIYVNPTHRKLKI